ncbi:MAG: HEXXH motif-containing putative peptide modification protein, partial [Flavobacterium nitrogenifigens]|uniref:aKG-HExxH-type peptide beta-hydroxylase n=1 Tax=Flavobacterium nitrogenifigens TaxID=1617283 RepID=UPI002807720E
IDLIKPGTSETFYSPWRDEQRPVRGVLHGMFVFWNIYNFYKQLLSTKSIPVEAESYLIHRMEDIEMEFKSISGFKDSEGVTDEGKKLSENFFSL